ncbi:hypothetical protein TrVFT333_003467 [Trichoderma virens FT-333]|nr:hypothetical protein TrVFT333_003467 [Trichoderma virens FT-333]
MFRLRVRSRLLERYERQVCEKLCRQTANGCERNFASAQASTRSYATGKTVAKANASRAVNKPAPGSTSSPRISSTTTTTTTTMTSSAAATKAAEAGALRTAEARDSALRAARMRRLAQQQDRLAEETKKKEEKREYKKRYDVAARKWVSTIIALPIFLVTSYYLFDRLVLRNEPKSLEKYRGRRSEGFLSWILDEGCIGTMLFHAFGQALSSFMKL